MPITSIAGRVVYAPGPWGSHRPVRNVAEVEIHVQNHRQPNNVQSVRFGRDITDRDGKFLITANLPPFLITRLFIHVINPCEGEMHNLQIERAIRPNAIMIPEDLGDLTVPWELPDPVIAAVNMISLRDTQSLARKLCELLRTPEYPVTVILWRESEDGTGQSYTPAQKLLIALKAPREGFASRIVGDIKDEVLSAKSETVNGAFIEILERLSLADIQVLEDGRLLNRLLAVIQRALGTHTYSESLMEDAARDMAVACVILFLAGLMNKDKVRPEISFRSSSQQCGGNVKRVVNRIVIEAAKG